MYKIGIIINPNARKIRKMKYDPAALYRQAGGDMAEVRVTRTKEDIVRAAKEFKKNKIEYLAISGGDGTIHLVLSEFINIYKKNKLPAVLILRDGTMNNIARSVGLKGNGPDLLKRLVFEIRNGHSVKSEYRDTIKVNDKYCFLFGLGLTTNYIVQYNSEGDRGPLMAAKVLIRGIFQSLTGKKGGLFERFRAKVTVDGKQLHFDDFIGIFAATVSTLNIGFAPASRAYEKKDTFHVIVSGMQPFELLPRLNKFRKGILLDHPEHFDNIASNMIIKSEEDFKYVMDGDIYDASRSLRVGCGPGIEFVYIKAQ